MRRRQDIAFPENGFESWGGYMQAKIAKLEEQYSHDVKTEVTKESNIFSGISIFVNGYTKPSSDELKLLMSQHGGTFHAYQRTGIDFVIASNLPDTKVKRLTSGKIVKPEWITDSIAAGQLLNYKSYLLYSKSTRTQPRLNFHQGQGNTVKRENIENKIEAELEKGINCRVNPKNVITVKQEDIKNKNEGEINQLHFQDIPDSKELLEFDDDMFQDDIILSPNRSILEITPPPHIQYDGETIEKSKANLILSKCIQDPSDHTNGTSEYVYEDMFHEPSTSGKAKLFETTLKKSENCETVLNDNEDNIDVSVYTKGLSQYLNDDIFVDDIPASPEGYKTESKQLSSHAAITKASNTADKATCSMQVEKLYTVKTASSSVSHETELMNAKRDRNKENMVSEKGASITAINPKFLSEFYNNSRLHHISQLGAAFKQYINDLRQASNFQFPKRDLLKKVGLENLELNTSDRPYQSDKVVMHIDMDCFFVSVGLRKHPHLKGQPVAVTHSKGGAVKPQNRSGVHRQAEFDLYKKKSMDKLLKGTHSDLSDKISFIEHDMPHRVDGVCEDEAGEFSSMSEIASCSYEARSVGIKNGMFMGAARRLCPNLQTIPYDFDGYKEVAYTLYNTIAQYTLDIEAVSCDEMYADCTELLSVTGLSVQQLATIVRKEIQDKTGCPCSTGFGSNRLQARMATKKAKPNGLFYLTQENVLGYFADIPVADLPGVGRQMQHKLSALNFATCGDLRNSTLSTLQKHFGVKTGQQLYQNCRGEDVRPLSFVTQRKSVSAEVNYGIRFKDYAQCEAFLKQLCEELHSRLQQLQVVGKAITVKLMVRAKDAPTETAKFMGHGYCDNITKTNSLNRPTDNLNVITKEVIQICQKLNVDPKEMRGIGIQISKLESLKLSRPKENKGGIWSQFQKINESKHVEHFECENEFQNKKIMANDDKNVKPLLPNDRNSEINSPRDSKTTNKDDKSCELTINKKNEIIKINMYENIVSAQKTPTKFNSLHGVTLQKTPIKNAIMLDFLKGEKSSEKKHSLIKQEAVNFNLKSTIEKLNFQNSPSIRRERCPIQMKTTPKKKTLGVARKRGRPPKHASYQEPKAVLPGGMDKFLNTKSHEQEEESLDLSGLDASVLAALPQDIRQEVLKQHRQEKRNKTRKPKNVNLSHTPNAKNEQLQIDEEFLAELPESLRMEILNEYRTNDKIDRPTQKKLTNINQKKKSPKKPQFKINDNIKPDTIKSKVSDPNTVSTDKNDLKSDILSLPWKQIREMLREWLRLETTPQRCDTQLMSSYMQHMVWNKEIESLMVLVNFLRRKVSEMGVCAWHSAYVQIMEGVQNSMLDVYGNKLMASQTFSCCSHSSM